MLRRALSQLLRSPLPRVARARLATLRIKAKPGSHRGCSTTSTPGSDPKSQDLVGQLLFKLRQGRHPPYSGKRKLLWLGVLGVGIVGLKSIFQVPAGHIGIVDVFGKVRDEPLEPGLHILNPLAKVHKVSVRTRVIQTDASVPSKEGLIVHLEVNALFHIEPRLAVQLFKTVGLNYADVLIMPHLKSAMRQLSSAHEAKALYTADTRELIGNKLTAELRSHLDQRGIIIEDTPLREIILPPKLTEAIEEKLRAEQESQRMQFVLQKEQGEAERKKIEAIGIAEFQRIVAEGISENLLRWKAIEATLLLARSPNSKVVVMGNGKDGLPVILSASEHK